MLTTSLIDYGVSYLFREPASFLFKPGYPIGGSGS